jgi:hypothetical protein
MRKGPGSVDDKWHFVPHIFHGSQPSRGGDRKTFKVMTSTFPVSSSFNNRVYGLGSVTRSKDWTKKYSGYIYLSFLYTDMWNHLIVVLVGMVTARYLLINYIWKDDGLRLATSLNNSYDYIVSKYLSVSW